MKSDPSKVNLYYKLASESKKRRIRKKNNKKYWNCFEVRMKEVDLGIDGVKYYQQELVLKKG